MSADIVVPLPAVFRGNPYAGRMLFHVTAAPATAATTPVELVAAPGAGRSIYLLGYQISKPSANNRTAYLIANTAAPVPIMAKWFIPANTAIDWQVLPVPFEVGDNLNLGFQSFVADELFNVSACGYITTI